MAPVKLIVLKRFPFTFAFGVWWEHFLRQGNLHGDHDSALLRGINPDGGGKGAPVNLLKVPATGEQKRYQDNDDESQFNFQAASPRFPRIKATP